MATLILVFGGFGRRSSSLPLALRRLLRPPLDGWNSGHRPRARRTNWRGKAEAFASGTNGKPSRAKKLCNNSARFLRTNANVLGYRRAEVWGHGSTVLKPGWWWTMTVTTNYSVQTLLGNYRDFWKSSNAVFVERIENPGGE